jgi:1-acyl-sn-glycerol-3-phosphate acyltransferase
METRKESRKDARKNEMDHLDAPFFPRRRSDRLLAFALAALVPLVLLFVLFHLVWGILVAAVLFRPLPVRARDALVRFWSRILLVAMGIRLELDAEADARAPVGATGALLLMNHVSWIDVFVVAAVVPVRFVAKSEVGSWPLAGWLAKSVDTVFVQRGRRHAVAQVNRVVAERLRAGQSIGVFPEGTTTDGTKVLRFHANLVQAAVLAQAPVVPVALQYWQDDAPSLAAAYIGKMTLVESMLRILVAPRLRVRLQLLAAVTSQGATRQAIAQQARRAISQALALPEYDLPDPTLAEVEMDALESTST